MGKSKTDSPSNREIAEVLEHIAALLEAQDANPHRVRAYRDGASRARALDSSLAEIVMSGDGESLQELPDIGQGLARVITRYVRNGRSDVLDRLQGEVSAQKLFLKVPGIGDELAERVADQLDINTLEELEQAAHDGRLAEVEGFGSKRIQNIRSSLAGMLSPAARRRVRQRIQDGRAEMPEQPDVATLLDVDLEYRNKAKAGELRKIAPRRFNPENQAWLPILHTSRNDWDFTVLFSNTARAHDLNKTNDWVVIYYEQEGHEDQATVVTASHGPLEGKRIVRGREAECEQYYE